MGGVLVIGAIAAATAAAATGLQQLLVELGYEPRLVVVEFNGAIVSRDQWPDQPVAAGDRLEVVTIVGGG